MFDILDNKVFKDSVHGYINIPRIFVEEIIDTDYFQRLRNIDQTSMRILFPDAKHDRFGHSLGVFYLGSKAVDALLSNFSQSEYWYVNSVLTENVKFWAKNKILFLIACLLHDIGHAPFSHSLEDLFGVDCNEFKIILQEKEEKANKTNKKYIKKEIEIEKEPAAHEIMGAKMVLCDEHVRKSITNIFSRLREQKFPRPQKDDILYAEHYKYDATVTEVNGDDFCFIARMITGIKYDDFQPERQIRNCFIELLNGSIFDIDQLDYILRDTHMSSISNFSIDVERLINSINIVHSSVLSDCQIEQTNYENKTVTDLILKKGSINIKGDVMGCISIPQGYKVTLRPGSTFEYLSANKDYLAPVYLDRFEDEKGVEFDPCTTIYIEGKRIGCIRNVRPISQRDGECQISNAKLKSTFEFKLNANSKLENKAYLSIRGNCDLTISSLQEKNQNEDDTSVKLDGTMRIGSATIFGKIDKLAILNGDIKEPSSKNKYVSLSIGYHKQAINIIANVIEARNYLYLWIYAHHKVVYYANFLLPGAVQKLTKDVYELEERYSRVPIINLSYDNLLQLDDSYCWTLIRQNGLHIKSGDNEGLNCLGHMCEAIVGHKYLSSLFKSFAEFDLLFELYSQKQKEIVMKNLCAQIDINKPYVPDKPRKSNNHSCLAGYLIDESLKEVNTLIKEEIEKIKDVSIKQKIKGNSISSIVYVNAPYKKKKLDMGKTYIVMRDEVVSMDHIPSLSEKKIYNNANAKYFYIYYKVERDGSLFTQKDKKEYKRVVMNAFIKYFNGLVKNDKDEYVKHN